MAFKLFFILTLIAAPRFTLGCISDLIRAAQSEGTRVTSEPVNLLFPDQEIFLLGKGNTASVYRVTSQGKVIHLKLFQDLKIGWDRETSLWAIQIKAETLCRDNLDAFNFLSSKREIIEPKGLKLITAKPLNAIALVLDPVQGKSVLDILKSAEIPLEAKQRIYLKYVERLNATAVALGVKMVLPGNEPVFTELLTNEMLPSIESTVTYQQERSSRDLFLHIVADGVFVNQNLDLYLTDPI